MPLKIAKSYTKSTRKLEFYIAENTGHHAQKILTHLVGFLKANISSRPPKRKKLEDGEPEMKDVTNNQKIALKDELASIGLGSLFRLIEKRAEMKAERKEELVVLMDSNFVGSTAIKQVIGFYAIGSLVPFYIIPNLCSTISKALNFKRCSVVTLHQRKEAAKIFKLIRDGLKPIDYEEHKQPANVPFNAPTLVTPIGKSCKKRQKRKMKRKMLI